MKSITLSAVEVNLSEILILPSKFLIFSPKGKSDNDDQDFKNS